MRILKTDTSTFLEEEWKDNIGYSVMPSNVE